MEKEADQLAKKKHKKKKSKSKKNKSIKKTLEEKSSPTLQNQVLEHQGNDSGPNAMIQTETDSKSDAEYPHGTFGNVLHALTFGILGNQKGRLDKHVESDYKVKAKSENIGAPNDYHPEEEF